MTDEQKRPPTSEEMVRRARERVASSVPEEAPAADSFGGSNDSNPPPQPDAGRSQSTPAERAYQGTTTTYRSPTTATSTPPSIPAWPSQPSRFGWLQRVPIGWLIAALVFAGGSIYRSIAAADRDDSGVIVGAGDLASDDVEVGDCLLFPDDTDPTASFEFDHLAAVPCSDPHDMEVYAQVSAPAGPYPGQTALSDLGDSLCQDPFVAYVGHPVEHEARLTFSAHIPARRAGPAVIAASTVSWRPGMGPR